ncbi:MAG: HAD-IG family 5'-nucleotidase [Thermoanaerobaculia bacterium]|nr:HAD-IG family 5'-nucleotidase [Thermoanaerobaculia bacterium]
MAHTRPYPAARQFMDDGLLDELPRSAELSLLHHALREGSPPRAEQIFVNRTLRMEKIRFVGFDLDWTLADYDHDAMSQTAFEMTLDRLVRNAGYPEAILKAEFRNDFCRRGSILDTEAGTVLKMNRHRYVGRAYLGRDFLDAKQRSDLYRREPINPASQRFYFVDTLFELPEVNIFSELVDLSLRSPEKLKLESYVQLFQDTRRAIDSIHADTSLKQRILGDIEHFLPKDPLLPLALQRLQMDGRKLLLITNSEWYYTHGLCRHLFEGALPGLDDWRDLFDLIVVSAGKPGFFKKDRPFQVLDADGNPAGEVEVPAWGGAYAGGSRSGLMQLLGTHGEQVLYVGDHIYGDILSSKLSSTWRTALVVSELEEELQVRRELAAQHRHMGVLRSELAELGLQMDDLRDVLSLYSGLAGNGDALPKQVRKVEKRLQRLRKEHKAMRQHAARLQARISQEINPYWGSLFKQGMNKSLFGSQVDDFACLYMSRVRNFAHYGSRHYYRVTADNMMHEVEI